MSTYEPLVGDIIEYAGKERVVFAVRPTHRTYGDGAGHLFATKDGLTFINDKDFEYIVPIVQAKFVRRPKDVGRKAVVINIGKTYITYGDFAKRHGFPDALYYLPYNGEQVTIIASGKHELGDALYIIQNDKGNRFIIEKDGVELTPETSETSITVIADETLGGVQREYREVKRKANVGERIKIVAANFTFGDYDNGDVFTVRYILENRGVVPNEVDDCSFGYIAHDEYVVLEPLSTADDVTYDTLTLEKRVEHLEEALKRLEERCVAAPEGNTAVDCDDIVTDVKAATNVKTQLTRDDVIQRAKDDVATLSTTWRDVYGDHPYFWPLTEGKKGHWVPMQRVDFVVNRDKRTVVALIKYIHTGSVYARGAAKCAPDDVFNVHIGKAIALRRALRMDVPSEYTNAPKPTEVRVGDYVEFDGYRVLVEPPADETGQCYNYTKGNCAIDSLVAEKGRIIDDSREDVPRREPKVGDKVRIVDATKTNIGRTVTNPDGSIRYITAIDDASAWPFSIGDAGWPIGIWSARECFELIDE